MGRQFTIDFPYTVSLGVSATSQLLCYLVSELKQARLAAEAGDVELVKWLLQELRADVNVECDQLHTPLSVALQHAPEAIVDITTHFGALSNSQNGILG